MEMTAKHGTVCHRPEIFDSGLRDNRSLKPYSIDFFKASAGSQAVVRTIADENYLNSISISCVKVYIAKINVSIHSFSDAETASRKSQNGFANEGTVR